MEKRREPRFEVDQVISLSFLVENGVTLPARVRNCSGRGLGLSLPGMIEPGTAIQIQADDALVLGEVVYSRREGDGCYAGVQLEQTLKGLSELARVLGQFEALSGAETTDPIR